MDIQIWTILLAQEAAEVAEQAQGDYGLGWMLTAGLIFLGLLGICAPRLRSKWPKEMREMKAQEAAREKKKAAAGKKKNPRRLRRKKPGPKRLGPRRRAPANVNRLAKRVSEECT